MGMRPVDMISIVGKTQDAAQAQQSNIRTQAIIQDHTAMQQHIKAERAAEMVTPTAPEDRLELTTENQGGSSGGEWSGSETEDETQQQDETNDHEQEQHINFLA